MAKRFIDTEIFDDPWFMDLSKDGKLLWIYLLTKCNHAGMLDLNFKLCTMQTGIVDVQKVKKELGKRLVTVHEQLIFIPKFIEFQYPDFPKSKVKQQEGAIIILKKYDLLKYLTLNKELLNSYDNDNVNGNGNGNVIEQSIKNFAEDLRNGFTHLEHCRKVYDLSEVEINKAVSKFIDFSIGGKRLYKTLDDVQGHLFMWLSKQPKDAFRVKVNAYPR